MSVLFGCLRVDPATNFEGIPVLDGEMIEFVVSDMIVDEFVELVKVVVGSHGVAVVLRVVVGTIPQRENANQKVEANASSIVK
jgi:hypothetical protein